jgi:hypothetical protein
VREPKEEQMVEPQVDALDEQESSEEEQEDERYSQSS